MLKSLLVLLCYWTDNQSVFLFELKFERCGNLKRKSGLNTQHLGCLCHYLDKAGYDVSSVFPVSDVWSKYIHFCDTVYCLQIVCVSGGYGPGLHQKCAPGLRCMSFIPRPPFFTIPANPDYYWMNICMLLHTFQRPTFYLAILNIILFQCYKSCQHTFPF